MTAAHRIYYNVCRETNKTDSVKNHFESKCFIPFKTVYHNSALQCNETFFFQVSNPDQIYVDQYLLISNHQILPSTAFSSVSGGQEGGLVFSRISAVLKCWVPRKQLCTGSSLLEYTRRRRRCSKT